MASFSSGSIVTLTANPVAGAAFREWRGACGGVSPTCILSVSGATSVTAVFSKVFTEDPLAPRASQPKASHVTELRAAIDTLRSRRGLAAFTWTDATPSAGSTPICAVHLTDLRTALGQAYQAAGRSVPAYTDPVLTPQQTPIKASHWSELRTHVRGLE
jgi:hypothetical protein